jgi:hypothetical protein
MNYGTMSPDNLTVSQTVVAPSGMVPLFKSVGSRDVSSGRYYLEFTVNDGDLPADEAVGVGLVSPDWSNSQQFTSDGSVWNPLSKTTDTGLVFSPGCVVGMAVGDNQVWFRVNASNWNGSPTANPKTGVGGIPITSDMTHFVTYVNYVHGAASVTVNTVAPFAHAMPAGYAPWANINYVPATFDPVTLGGTSYNGIVYSSYGALSNDNLTLYSSPTSGGGINARSLTPANLAGGGKYYLEFTTTSGPLATPDQEATGVGLSPGPGAYFGGFSAKDWTIYSDGTVWINSVNTETVPIAWSGGDVVGMAVGGGQVWLRVNNGPWNGDAAADPVAGVGGKAFDPTCKYFQGLVGYYRTYGNVSLSVTTVPPFAYPVPAGHQVWPSGATTAPLALSGVSPTNLNDGNVWFDGNNLDLRSRGITYSLDKRPVGDTFDPLTATGTGFGYFSDGNATITGTNAAYFFAARSCIGHDLSSSHSKEYYYVEFTVYDPHPGWWLAGVGVGTQILNVHTNISFPGGAADSVGVLDDGTIWSNDVAVPSVNLGAFTAPMTVVGMAVGSGQVWFRLNGGNWNGSPTATPGGDDTGAIDLGVGGIPIPAGA